MQRTRLRSRRTFSSLSFGCSCTSERERTEDFLQALDRLPESDRREFAAKSGYRYDELSQLSQKDRKQVLSWRYLLIAYLATLFAFVLIIIAAFIVISNTRSSASDSRVARTNTKTGSPPSSTEIAEPAAGQANTAPAQTPADTKQPTVLLVKIAASGRIHDSDLNNFLDPDEEESYSMSKDILVSNPGPSGSFDDQRTVDGEVRLHIQLAAKAEADDKVTVHGELELWEGPNWNKGAAHRLDPVTVSTAESRIVFDGRIADNEGDWATVKLEIQNTKP